jgi:hypothetical protein
MDKCCLFRFALLVATRHALSFLSSHHLTPPRPPQHRTHTRTQGERDEQVLRRLRPGHGGGLARRHHPGVCPPGQVRSTGGEGGREGGREESGRICSIRNDSHAPPFIISIHDYSRLSGASSLKVGVCCLCQNCLSFYLFKISISMTAPIHPPSLPSFLR